MGGREALDNAMSLPNLATALQTLYKLCHINNMILMQKKHRCIFTASVMKQLYGNILVYKLIDDFLVI